MSEDPWSFRKCSSGFTLIEVIAALVIFAGGVLMVIQFSGSLSAQMEWAATTSEIVVLAQERLDSLEAVPFDSLSVGSSITSVTVRGTSYSLTTTITLVTAILLQLDVSIAPAAGSGPSYATTSYAADNW